MFSCSQKTKSFTTVAVLGIALTLSQSTAATAQDRGFPGPPPGRGPGGPGGFGRGPRPATVAGTPVRALTVGLKLSDVQKTKIAAIQSQFRQQREKRMPRPVMTEEGPTEADFRAMRANGEWARALEQSVSAKITALLTPEQKKALPALLQESELMRSVGIPLELSQELKLTAVQKSRIMAIARSARQKREAAMRSGEFRPGSGGYDRETAHRAALSSLTPTQKTTVAVYGKAHPRRERGFGGPPPPPM